jgi:hypothetical protein
LKLQIEIHCGGPIIAGILGRDKPLFDVYGDSVNMSARLETTAPADSIHVLKDLANALPPDTMTFRERPNVALKGKGIHTTYLMVVSYRAPLRCRLSRKTFFTNSSQRKCGILTAFKLMRSTMISEKSNSTPRCLLQKDRQLFSRLKFKPLSDRLY